MLSTKTTALMMLAIAINVFRAATDDDDDPSKWTRLCTYTSEGGSRHNVSMPCGVQVESQSDEAESNEGPVNYVRIDVKNVRGGGATQDDGDETQGDGGETQDNGDEGLERTGIVDRGTKTENLVGLEQNEEIVATGNQDEAVNDYNGKHVEYDVTVEADDYDGGEDDERQEQLGSVPVKSVVLSYLQDAKKQLYNKIHYLLSLLQNAFLKARLDSRRSYRDLIDRRNALKSEGRQAGSNKQFLANFSSMLKPPFERSMMTMSFLMFGVFVVQVVQRLMQTLQQSSDLLSMGNPVQGNLPTASASIF